MGSTEGGSVGVMVTDGCNDGRVETDGTAVMDGHNERSGVGPWLTDGKFDGFDEGVMEGGATVGKIDGVLEGTAVVVGEAVFNPSIRNKLTWV